MAGLATPSSGPVEQPQAGNAGGVSLQSLGAAAQGPGVGSLTGQSVQVPSAQNGFNAALGTTLGGYQATAAAENAALGQQQQVGYATQQTTDQQLQQQYQDTLQQLGLSTTEAGQQNQYTNATYGLTQQGNQLSQTGLQESLANLQQQYGFTQQNFGLQTNEANQGFQQGTQNLQEGSAGSGVLGTGTQRQGQSNLQTSYQNTLQSLGIQEGQAASNYNYGLQQNSNSEGQLGLQKQQEALSNQYSGQQYQDTLQSLGLSRTQAGQSYTTGTQQAADTYANLAAQTGAAQQANDLNAENQASALMAQLYQSGMYTG